MTYIFKRNLFGGGKCVFVPTIYDHLKPSDVSFNFLKENIARTATYPEGKELGKLLIEKYQTEVTPEADMPDIQSMSEKEPDPFILMIDLININLENETMYNLAFSELVEAVNDYNAANKRKNKKASVTAIERINNIINPLCTMA